MGNGILLLGECRSLELGFVQRLGIVNVNTKVGWIRQTKVDACWYNIRRLDLIAIHLVDIGPEGFIAVILKGYEGKTFARL